VDDRPAKLERLKLEVDRHAGELSALHAGRLRCRRGCSGCCSDELTVLEVEAEQIRRRHPDLLEHGEPHPPGACAFLDAAGACRIYASRPYVCRTQGLPLRWLEEDEQGEIVEQRDICPLNAEGPALTTLDEQACLTLGPYEEQLVRLQELGGRALVRVALRDLFSRSRRRASDSR
jgi:Fe-S-cluster containining protein